MIGSLREKAIILAAVDEPDGLGGKVRSFRIAFEDWIGVEPLGTTTDTETGRSLRRFRVTLRYRDDVPVPGRLHWRGYVLAIRSSDDPDLRAQRLHLICEET